MAQPGEEVGKMFVGGLSWETTQETLCRYFSRFGEVIDCVVMKNSETGRSRGFGFVTFKDPACVDMVLSSGQHSLDGRTIDPKSCNPRSMQKQQQKVKGGNPKIFLGGLPSNVTETDLRNFFLKYGKVVEVVIMYDQERKRSRGFGFLSFETEDAVERVCAEHYVTINGKQVECIRHVSPSLHTKGGFQVECKRAEPREGKSSGGRSHSQWNGSNMGHGGMPPMGGPPMGGPPMPPNGMPGYQQAGWGGPPSQGGYGQGGYGGAPGSGYQGWGPPPTGYPPFPPGPMFGHPPQGYPPYGPPPGSYGYNWAPPGAPMIGAVAPPAPVPPPSGASTGAATSGATEKTPTQSSGTMSTGGNTNQSATGSGSKSDFSYANTFGSGMANFQQESSRYGPQRHTGSQDGFNSSSNNFGGGEGASQGNYNSTSFGRSSGQSQGYHPYRRQ